jgi:glutamate racemase
VLAERLLEPIRRAGVDTLILGCTHYPLLARTIGDVMGPDVVLVSSADETAFAARAMMGPGVVRTAGVHRFLTSGDPEQFARLGGRFLGPEVGVVEAWRWS